MSMSAPGSLDAELKYLSDVAEREAELKRLNEEIDMELNLSGEDKEDKEEIMGKKAMLGKKLYPAAAKGPVLGEVTNKYGRGSERKLGGVGKGKVMERTVVEEGVEEEGGGQSELVMTKHTSSIPSHSPASLDVSSDIVSSPSPVDRSHNVPLYSPSTEAPTEASASPSQLNSPNPEIGTSAQLRFQKARIKSLTVQLQEQVNLKGIAEKSLSGLQKKFKAQSEDAKRMHKSIADLTSSNAKMKGEGERAKKDVDAYKREISALKKEVMQERKEKQQGEKEHKAREIRLSRALEECEKFKKTLLDATSETQGMGSDYRKDKEKLRSQVRALERQRGELLAAFKKQCKLIEVMKRQKVHTEAAKLLEFTEEEFVKVLDWGN
ncbi:hypothetical protein TrRE_jg8254 [Triparma retinervis]|uniref:Testis expressed 9 n=1 Tax=Triparma retinervis TaxID=2557542 RepID=A0A9W7EBQ1_9STRA|nr:hypothetical protein TrRE_jg8254 [Triparma retinervis]